MRLAAMVGLVVEEMIERRRQRLLDGLRVDHGAIADDAVEVVAAQAGDVAADENVLAAAGGAQGAEIFIQDGIEAFRGFAGAGEAPHPDTVADQQVVQGSVQRFEEGAAVGAVIGVAERARRVIKSLVAPGIVAGKHQVAGSHGCLMGGRYACRPKR